LRENFPTAQCTGAKWIGALADVDNLCLCADSAEELIKMITVAPPHTGLRIIEQKYIMGQEKARLLLSTKLPPTKQVGGKLPG